MYIYVHVHILFGNSSNLTCEQSSSRMQPRHLTRNELERAQDALEYPHEEKCTTRNLKLLK